MSDLFAQPFAFVDLETTGANPARDRITEIGVVEWDGVQLLEWSTLVNPQVPIPSFIQSLTGISDAMVASAPTFAELAENLRERLAGKLFFAHNARFDYGFLKQEFKRLDLRFHSRAVCTVKLSRKLFPGEYKHNLDSVVARMGLQVEGDRHRALTDAQLIQRFVEKLRDDLGEPTLKAAIDEISRQPALPPGIDPEQIDELPEGHGVYLFYDEQGGLLYVGKSVHLRKRVLAHFAADNKIEKERVLAQLVRRLDWVSTAGELGALLLESKLIKQLQPTYNHKQRRNDELCSWRFIANAEGDAKPELLRAQDYDLGAEPELFGLYGSEREAKTSLRKLADGHRLCHVLLGLEKASRRHGTPCFGHQIGKCRGACVGKESKLTHQARLIAALAKSKLARWPYAGVVALRERNQASAAEDWHLLDRWRYLGTASDEAALQALLDDLPQPPFDADIYKLLAKYLREGKVELRPLPAYTQEADGSGL